MQHIIVIGLSSSLGAVLYPKLKDNFIISTFFREVENEMPEKNKWKAQLFNSVNGFWYKTPEEMHKTLDMLMKDNRTDMLLYLSSVGDLTVLETCRNHNVPNLVIGSGAFTDWLAGRIDITKVPKEFGEYVQGKARETFLAYTMIHPGFYLAPRDALYVGSGLHVNTFKFMFSDNFDETQSWGKDKFVTPMNHLCQLIEKWCMNPEKYKQFQGPFGTDSAYPRWYLRELAGLDVPEDVKLKNPLTEDSKYQMDVKRTKNIFETELTGDDLKRACVESREWAGKQKLSESQRSSWRNMESLEKSLEESLETSLETMEVISDKELVALQEKAILKETCEDGVLSLCFLDDYKAEIYRDKSYTFVRDGNHENSGFLRDVSPTEFEALLPKVCSFSSSPW